MLWISTPKPATRPAFPAIKRKNLTKKEEVFMGEVVDISNYREKKGKGKPEIKTKKSPYYMPLEELIKFASDRNKKDSK